MKLTMENIPIWDAFQSSKTECPICTIEEKTENKLLEVLFLEMVMDGEFNDKLGREYDFCREHFRKLYNYHDKMGLALMVEKMLSSYKNNLKMSKISAYEIARAPGNIIHRLFNDSADQNYFYERKCYICSNIESICQMNLENMIMLWESDENFRSLYAISKGFCINHYNKIMTASETLITDVSTKRRFKEITLNVEEKNLERLQEELEWFIKKFDYRYRDLSWKNSKDSLPRSILKLSGSFVGD